MYEVYGQINGTRKSVKIISQHWRLKKLINKRISTFCYVENHTSKYQLRITVENTKTVGVSLKTFSSSNRQYVRDFRRYYLRLATGVETRTNFPPVQYSCFELDDCSTTISFKMVSQTHLKPFTEKEKNVFSTVMLEIIKFNSYIFFPLY